MRPSRQPGRQSSGALGSSMTTHRCAPRNEARDGVVGPACPRMQAGPAVPQVARFVLLTFMACCESSASDLGVDFVLGALLPAMVRTVALPGVARACA